MKNLWVIPTKIDSDNFYKLLKECVESIRTHYPEGADILLVDSDSADKSYMDDPYFEGVTIANIQNKNYEMGALVYALKNYDADYYSLMQDSCRITQRVDYVFERPVTIAGGPKDWEACDGGGRDWGLRELEKTCYKDKILERFQMAIWQVVIAKHEILYKMMITNGLEHMLATNKHQDQAWERMLGMILTIEGYGEYLTSHYLGQGYLVKTWGDRK